MFFRGGVSFFFWSPDSSYVYRGIRALGEGWFTTLTCHAGRFCQVMCSILRLFSSCLSSIICIFYFMLCLWLVVFFIFALTTYMYSFLLFLVLDWFLLFLLIVCLFLCVCACRRICFLRLKKLSLLISLDWMMFFFVTRSHLVAWSISRSRQGSVLVE